MVKLDENKIPYAETALTESEKYKKAIVED